MSRLEKWYEAQGIDLVTRPTWRVYQDLVDAGVRTVEFEHFVPGSLDVLLERSEGFIEQFAPILFIYELDGANKDMFFNVNDKTLVLEWSHSTPRALEHDILLSSQISGYNGSFSGSIFSDGKGRTFCDTYHEPGTFKQTVVSNGKGEGEFCAGFETIDSQVERVWGNYLRYEDIAKLFNAVSDREGYFEFVYGDHLGKKELVFMGYEPLKIEGYKKIGGRYRKIILDLMPERNEMAEFQDLSARVRKILTVP